MRWKDAAGVGIEKTTSGEDKRGLNEPGGVVV